MLMVHKVFFWQPKSHFYKLFRYTKNLRQTKKAHFWSVTDTVLNLSKFQKVTPKSLKMINRLMTNKEEDQEKRKSKKKMLEN